ncbi:choline ABC transporter permease subunit, partial [Rhizobiaceae sp. 2RAB30]
MDPISKLLVAYKIPIGAWGKAFFTFLTDNFNALFRGFSGGLNFILDSLVDTLLLLPPVAVVALVALLAWY